MNRHKIVAQTKKFTQTSAQAAVRKLAMISANFSSYERIAFALFFLIFVLFSIMLWSIDKREFIPASFGAIAAAAFAFLAFRFTKEKFRLDLFEKRWSVYEGIVQFCSVATQTGVIGEAAYKAAGQCMRGTGYHKTKALFGPEILELINRLNESSNWLEAHGGAPLGDAAQATWAEKTHEHEMNIFNTVNELPKKFEPYLFFGEYKRWHSHFRHPRVGGDPAKAMYHCAL